MNRKREPLIKDIMSALLIDLGKGLLILTLAAIALYIMNDIMTQLRSLR